MHNHKECCKHENIKFCEKCKVPYCEDCGKEWAEVCQLSHYPNWYPVTIPSYPVIYETGDPIPNLWEVTCGTPAYMGVVDNEGNVVMGFG